MLILALHNFNFLGHCVSWLHYFNISFDAFNISTIVAYCWVVSFINIFLSKIPSIVPLVSIDFIGCLLSFSCHFIFFMFHQTLKYPRLFNKADDRVFHFAFSLFSFWFWPRVLFIVTKSSSSCIKFWVPVLHWKAFKRDNWDVFYK